METAHGYGHRGIGYSGAPLQPQGSDAEGDEGHYPNLALAYYVHALPEYGLVYIKNPKAGCSTVLVWLSRLHSGQDDKIREEVGIRQVPVVKRNVRKTAVHGSVYDGRPDLERQVREIFASDFELYGY